MLTDYENSLTTDRESYNTYVKSKATNQLLKEYHEHIGKNDSEIEKLRKDTAEIRKLLDGYTQEKAKANVSYLSNLGTLFVELDILSTPGFF